MRRQFELSNDLAAGLAGDHDAMLRALEERLHARVYLRGNLLTLDGEPAALETGARVINELGTLAPSGHPLDEATLSFLGVGLPPTQPSLGTLIRIGDDFLFSGQWWVTIFPGLALVLMVLSINLLGDWLRDALNPRLR